VAGGTINIRLRTDAEINGLDVGTDGGSFGYLNNYFAHGNYGENWDSSIFFSNIIGNGLVPRAAAPERCLIPQRIIRRIINAVSVESFRRSLFPYPGFWRGRADGA
jgi:hypothetical protein